MIRINLLAEQQAAEEMRRRDPVKRAIWGAGFLVFLVLVWIGFLQLKVMQSSTLLVRTASRWQVLAPQDGLVRTNLKKTSDLNKRLEALSKLSTNRFLWTAPLNALQYCMISNVVVTEIVLNQKWTTNEAKIDPDSKKVLKPAAATEEISLTINFTDFAPAGEGNHNKFIDAVKSSPYFKDHLRKTNAIRGPDRMGKQGDGAEGSSGTKYSFTCFYPDVVR